MISIPILVQDFGIARLTNAVYHLLYFGDFCDGLPGFKISKNVSKSAKSLLSYHFALPLVEFCLPLWTKRNQIIKNHIQ